MDLLQDVMTLVKWLRKSPDVTLSQAKQAVRDLVDAGLSWWVGQGGDTCLPELRAACPLEVDFDPNDREKAADFLEACCHTSMKAAGAGKTFAGAFPWAQALGLLLDLAKQVLGDWLHPAATHTRKKGG